MGSPRRHPQQATQTGLLQVDLAVHCDGLRLSGHDIQPRGFAGNFRQLARDSDQLPNLLAAVGQVLLVREAMPWRRHDDYAGEFVLSQIVSEPFGVDPVVAFRGPRHGRDVPVVQLEGVTQRNGQQVRILGSVEQ